MLQRHLIYALLDPDTDRIRYIGKSSTGLKRPRQHWEPAALLKDRNPFKRKWLQDLLALNKKPIIVVLERSSDAQTLSEKEIFWISVFHGVDSNLTNLTDGGDGAGIGNQIWKGRTHSQETRKKLSSALRGNKNSLGFKHAPGSIERSRLGSLGLKRSDEARAKMRAAKLGKKRKPHSAETIERIKETKRRRGEEKQRGG